MTRSDHKSGTDRICEALDKIGIFYDVVINIQGDEPFIQKSQIKTVMNCFDDPQTQIATLGKHFKSMESAKIQILQKLFWIIILMLFISPALLYLLCEGMQKSEWIERYPFLKHIGLYAYRTDVLRAISRLPQSSLELAESLEQLRWLQNGYRIKVGLTDVETIGIDTPEDLERAEIFLRENKV